MALISVETLKGRLKLLEPRHYLVGTLVSLGTLKLFARLLDTIHEKRRVAAFLDQYPEPYKNTWLGIAGQIEMTEHGQTEKILIERNILLDQAKSPRHTIGWICRFAPGVRLFAASDPNLARFLLGLRPDIVKKGGLSDMLFGDDPKGFIGGLLYEEGVEWHKSRKVLNEEFNQASLDTYVAAMDETVQLYIDKLLELGAGTEQSLSTVTDLTNQLTLEVMMKTVFGDGQFELLSKNGNHEIAHAFKDIIDAFQFKFANVMTALMIRLPLIGATLGTLFCQPIRQMYHAFNIRDKYFSRLIRNKRNELVTGDSQRDLITILLKCVDPINQQPMFSQSQIQAQMYTFLFAGFETTSTAIISLLFHLGDEPVWVDKICEEFESHSRVINSDTLKQMPLTTAFIKETVRLASPLDMILPRKLAADVKLPNGAIMPKGTEWTVDLLRMSQYDKAASLGNCDPLKFDPTRFLDENSKTIHPYQNIPFSAGRRSCIGRHFAMQQLKIVACRLATQIKVRNTMRQKTAEKALNRPAKALSFTWKINRDALSLSFEPIK